jgi:IclR family acetate operon transcriptional repressor
MSAEHSGSSRERNPIAALTRVLGAMAAMDEQSIGVRELARILGSPPSSIQRTLDAAEELSLVESHGGQWQLGWELYRLASIVQAKRPFDGAMAVLEELSSRTEETALLVIYDPQRQERMFAAASESHRSVRFVPELNTWLPMHASASALAVLAFRPEPERQALYAQGLPPLGENESADDVEVALEAIRRDGYAVSHDGVYLGASGVAAPIVTHAGITSSVAVILPRQRFDEADQAQIIAHVKSAADTLGHRLGNPLSGVVPLS